MWVTGGAEAVLQLQHRDDLAAGWGAERVVQMRTDRAVWLEPGWGGRYRMAAGRQRDQGEGVTVRKEWGGELPRAEKDVSGVRAHFTKAALAQAPTLQGQREQEVVYAFLEEMTLKATEASKMSLDEGAAHTTNHTYHVQPHTGDKWHYAFPGGGRHEEYSTTAAVCEIGQRSIGPRQYGRRMGAGDGRGRARDADGGGHLVCEVPQGRMDDTQDTNVIFPWQ